MLKFELQDLSALGANLSMLGFSKSELAQALTPAATGLTDEDETPAPAKAAVSRAGDIWCLGPHRIICGDCTEPKVVSRLLEGRQPQLMVTDPPYGVEYDPSWRHTPPSARALSATTIRRIGAKPGDCFPATSPMSGTERCTPALSRRASPSTDLPFVPRSSGPKSGS
jgi:hypothetical protein